MPGFCDGGERGLGHSWRNHGDRLPGDLRRLAVMFAGCRGRDACAGSSADPELRSDDCMRELAAIHWHTVHARAGWRWRSQGAGVPESSSVQCFTVVLAVLASMLPCRSGRAAPTRQASKASSWLPNAHGCPWQSAIHVKIENQHWVPELERVPKELGPTQSDYYSNHYVALHSRGFGTFGYGLAVASSATFRAGGRVWTRAWETDCDTTTLRLAESDFRDITST